MEKHSNIVLRAKRICFTKKCIKITDLQQDRYEIPYRDLVMAGIRSYDRETGMVTEPGITDITKDLEGNLFLRTMENSRITIMTDVSEKAAGEVLLELSTYAPYILIGKQTWFDAEDEEDFAEISEMVELMYRCR